MSAGGTVEVELMVTELCASTGTNKKIPGQIYPKKWCSHSEHPQASTIQKLCSWTFIVPVVKHWSGILIPCEELVSPTPNERETTASNRLLFHRACASSSRPTWCFWCQFHFLINFCLQVFVQKNANFSRKALAKKKRSKPSSKYGIYLVCGLHIKPKF